MTDEITIQFDRESDGRWIAEAVDEPGMMAYGATQDDALQNVLRLMGLPMPFKS